MPVRQRCPAFADELTFDPEMRPLERSSRMSQSRLIGLSVPCLAFAACLAWGEKPLRPEQRSVVVYELYRPEAAVVHDLSASADGKRLLTVSCFTARVWDLATSDEVACFGHRDESQREDQAIHKDCTNTAALSPDGRLVAAYFYERKKIRIFDVASNRLLRSLDPGDYVKSLAFSPDGKTLAIATLKTVHLWDVTEGEERLTLNFTPPGDEDLWRQVAFSPDGRTIAAAGGSVRLCDAETGAEKRRLTHLSDALGEPFAASFSRDGKLLAVSQVRTCRAWIYETATGKALRTLDCSSPDFESSLLVPCDPHSCTGTPAFTPDGKAVLIPCSDGERLWEVATGCERFVFDLYRYGNRGCVVFPRADLLVAADSSVRCLDHWNASTLSDDQPIRLGSKDFDRLWDDLASPDAQVGYRAVVVLASAPQESVEALASRLNPDGPAAAELDGLLAGLDDDAVAVREAASRRLAEIGEPARSKLAESLARKPSAEAKERIEGLLARLDGPPAPERLRRLRAVEALEDAGTPGARRLLRKLADGPDGTETTEEARAALCRLDRR
jgi:WD40 repeat protein